MSRICRNTEDSGKDRFAGLEHDSQMRLFTTYSHTSTLRGYEASGKMLQQKTSNEKRKTGKGYRTLHLARGRAPKRRESVGFDSHAHAPRPGAAALSPRWPFRTTESFCQICPTGFDQSRPFLKKGVKFLFAPSMEVIVHDMLVEGECRNNTHHQGDRCTSVVTCMRLFFGLSRGALKSRHQLLPYGSWSWVISVSTERAQALTRLPTPTCIKCPSFSQSV